MNFDDIRSSFESFNPAIGLALFAIYLVVDALYAYYTLSVTKRRPFAAATTGFIMHFMLAFGVINYTHNYLYVVPLALGSWIGTFVVVKYEQQKNTPQ